MAGRPRQRPVLECKKLTKARYKYVIGSICRNEAMRADSMAKKLHGNNAVDFWKEVRVLNKCKTSLPCTVGGISGTDNIVELWPQHYTALFNCVKSDLYKADNTEWNDSVRVMIMSHDAYQAVNKLSDSKASGLDHITAEHLKYASLRTAPLLAICCSGFMIRDLSPDSMLSVLLVPVIKDKAGKLDNYKPTASASILSEVHCWIDEMRLLTPQITSLLLKLSVALTCV